MKTTIFSILFLAAISVAGCSAGRESTAGTDSMSVGTTTNPPGNVMDTTRIDTLRSDTVRRDSM